MTGDPLDSPPPAFSVEEAAGIAHRLFGIRGTVGPLRSERDQNFRVDSEDGRYLLKIANRADERAVVEMQTDAILHVIHRDPTLPVMRLVRSTEGGRWAEVEGRGGPHLVRMFTFLQGRMARAAELDREALRRFGATVARMGLALRGFFHAAAGYEILWDLRHTPRLRAILDSVEDLGRRAVAERVLDRFEERVAPAFGGLRAQVVHNDLTIDNVLVDDADRVSGIVDFGDLTHTALVCDLAVSLASLIWDRPDPFEAATAAIAGYAEVAPLEDVEAALLGDLVAARMTAWGVIAAWRSRRYPENADYITAGDAEAWRLLEDLDRLGFPEVERRFQDAVDTAGLPYRREATTRIGERRRRVLGRSPLMYERPVHLVRGEGAWLFDAEGHRYLDAYNNVPVVGHGHRRVVEAIARQSRLLNTHSRYLHEAAVELGECLVATLPPPLDTVLFVNSGSEANDLAWRLAAAATGRRGAVVTERAYHGVTEATSDLSPEEWPEGERPGRVELIPPPDAFRARLRGEPEDWPERAAGHLDRAVGELGHRGQGLGVVMVDPALTSDGVLVPPPAYLRELARRAREAGGLLVADEVQAGHGRYGAHLWSFQASGIEPDVVTMGKPMGNGHPVAAVVTTRDIAEALTTRTEVFSTFGGNPVSCAAALAVLQVIEEEGILDRVADVGTHLRGSLERLAATHELIGDVRGEGLLVGVELVRDRGSGAPATEDARATVEGMRERGVLVGLTGPADNVLKIRPPLVVTRDQVNLLVEALDESLRSLP